MNAAHIEHLEWRTLAKSQSDGSDGYTRHFCFFGQQMSSLTFVSTRWQRTVASIVDSPYFNVVLSGNIADYSQSTLALGVILRAVGRPKPLTATLTHLSAMSLVDHKTSVWMAGKSGQLIASTSVGESSRAWNAEMAETTCRYLQKTKMHNVSVRRLVIDMLYSQRLNRTSYVFSWVVITGMMMK